MGVGSIEDEDGPKIPHFCREFFCRISRTFENISEPSKCPRVDILSFFPALVQTVLCHGPLSGGGEGRTLNRLKLLEIKALGLSLQLQRLEQFRYYK